MSDVATMPRMEQLHAVCEPRGWRIALLSSGDNTAGAASELTALEVRNLRDSRDMIARFPINGRLVEEAAVSILVALRKHGLIGTEPA